MNLYTAKPLPPFELCMDNKGASDLIGSQLGTNRSKHIDTRFHFTRDLVATGVLRITLVPSKDNAADGFTKPLRAENFERFLDLIGLDWI